jgi:hypothetical protein
VPVVKKSRYCGLMCPWKKLWHRII